MSSPAKKVPPAQKVGGVRHKGKKNTHTKQSPKKNDQPQIPIDKTFQTQPRYVDTLTIFYKKYIFRMHIICTIIMKYNK